jgi:hypothetical protein
MSSILRLVSALLVLSLVAACGDSKPEGTPAKEPADAPAPAPLVSTVTPTAETLAKLAAADMLDGKEDKVITRCASCGLHMLGDPKFTCRIGEYTLQSCTDHCSHAVCDDPNGLFADLEVPTPAK